MKEEIIKLRNEGKTYNEIKNILGCSKSTISYHCSKIETNNKIKDVNNNVKNVKQKKDKLLIPNDEIINEIVRLRKLKYTYKEIAEELNVSRNEISNVCRKLKIHKNYKGLSDDKIKEIKELYDELKSSRKVEKISGVSRSTILKYVNVIKKEKKITKSEAVINWRKRTKIKLIEYKGGKCEKCGYDKYSEVLEFHHKDPNEKDFAISGKSWSFERLKKEVDKCILLCANCHREIHIEQKMDL